MNETENEKYLEQVLSKVGTNNANINYRVGKGIRKKNKLKCIIEHRAGREIPLLNCSDHEICLPDN